MEYSLIFSLSILHDLSLVLLNAIGTYLIALLFTYYIMIWAFSAIRSATKRPR